MSTSSSDEETASTSSRRPHVVMDDLSNPDKGRHVSPSDELLDPSVRYTDGHGIDKIPESVTPVKRPISDVVAAQVPLVPLPHHRNSKSTAPSTPKTKREAEKLSPQVVARQFTIEPSSPTISSEPHEQIEDFDWQELSSRYHERVKELDNEESKIFEEYTELSNAFAVWAQSGPKQESGSSYKRLKTQMKYVRNEEDQLEQRRMHYVKVIEAFQSALQLLGS